MTPWQRVNMARHPQRPLGVDYLAALDAVRRTARRSSFRRRPAIVGGFAKLARPARHGDRARQRQRHERKCRPQLRYAVAPRLSQSPAAGGTCRRDSGLPIVTFIDTPGADPGIASEEHEQSEAIAQSLDDVRRARVSDRGNGHRRRRQRRRARASACRPCDDARAQRLFGRLARRLCGDSVGRCRESGRSRVAFAAHQRRSSGLRHRR